MNKTITAIVAIMLLAISTAFAGGKESANAACMTKASCPQTECCVCIPDPDGEGCICVPCDEAPSCAGAGTSCTEKAKATCLSQKDMKTSKGKASSLAQK